MSSNPDEIITHKLKGRCRCRTSLSTSAVKETIKRQVFDLCSDEKLPLNCKLWDALKMFHEGQDPQFIELFT